MIFSLDMIRQITVGAACVYEDSEGYRFSKLTSSQTDAINEIAPHLINNARATTGVRFDLHTNSPYLRYCTLTDGRYELMVDDVITDKTFAKRGEVLEHQISDDGCMHRVTLLLPSHDTSGGLKSFEIADTATYYRHRFDMKMLFMGDSITQGWNSGEDHLSYAYLVSRHFNADSIIQGIGGMFFDSRIIDKTDFDPNIIIIAYGTNDADIIRDLDEMKERSYDFFVKCRALYSTAYIVAVTPPMRASGDTKRAYGDIRDVSDVIYKSALSSGIDAVRGEELLPCDSRLYADAIHPNKDGFAIYAKNLIKYIESKK